MDQLPFIIVFIGYAGHARSFSSQSMGRLRRSASRGLRIGPAYSIAALSIFVKMFSFALGPSMAVITVRFATLTMSAISFI